MQRKCRTAEGEILTSEADPESDHPTGRSWPALAEGRVAEVLIADKTITGKLKSLDSKGKTVIVATRVEPDLAARLSRYDVPYAQAVESSFLLTSCPGFCRRWHSLPCGSFCSAISPRSRAWAVS